MATATTGVSAAAPQARDTSRDAAEKRPSGRAFNVVAGIVLGVFAVIWLIPSLFALKASLSSNGDAALGAGTVISNLSPTLGSYSTLLASGDIWAWYLSSFLTAGVTTVLAVLFASMAGYALSKLRFPGRRLVFAAMLLGIMVPPQVLVVPIFQMLDGMGLLNTYWAVIFPQVPTVIAVFVFKQFFDGLPKEFDEAARIDGAGYWKIYRRIVMPLSGPIIAAMAIITFVGTWNNLILPLFVVSNPELMTIPVGLATVQGSFGQRYADIQASAILGALPLIILYMIFQRRIIEGVAGSGLKG